MNILNAIFLRLTLSACLPIALILWVIIALYKPQDLGRVLAETGNDLDEYFNKNEGGK